MTFPKNRRSRRGYTAVEVLSAMTLFAIGAAGVISMQRVTVQGGEDARRYDMATNIANEWLSRLQRDSMTWTKPNADEPTVTNIGTTQWLKDVATSGCITAFCNPPLPTSAATALGSSPAFDSWGRDVHKGSDDHFYCVQYKLQWIADPGTAPDLKITALMRAEVRVFWTRLEYATVKSCEGIDPDADPTMYHFVYATTALRGNPRR